MGIRKLTKPGVAVTTLGLEGHTVTTLGGEPLKGPAHNTAHMGLLQFIFIFNYKNYKDFIG